MANDSIGQALGLNIWRVDGPQVVFAGAPMHTRMTVVRLPSGGLWVHSPIFLSTEVADFLGTLLGESAEGGVNVEVVIAPNKYHHLFVAQWREAYPSASIFAEPKLMAKEPSLRTAQVISSEPPDVYGAVIDQLIFLGNPVFQEAVFFHKESRTLILTDLMFNLKLDGVGWLPALFLRFEGVVFPNGGLPRLMRWFAFDRAAAKACVEKMLAWAPAQITFCHGEDLAGSAEEVLRREFRWLL